MPKKSTKTILAALRRAGVSSEDLDKVTTELDDLELDAEEFIGSDQIILTKSEHRELKDDLTKLRQRAKDAETSHKELQDAVDAGDSDNARKATAYKKKLDEMTPTFEKLLERQKETWKAQAEEIPENLKKKFRFPEEGKELTTDDLLHNTSKLEEYTELGLIGEGAPEPDPNAELAPGPPNAPRTPTKGPAKKISREELDKMAPAQMVEAGYAPKKE